ncbi:MAG: hypothetical protein G01um101419_17 [Parcubacteria group bacterium Gr01-1014_19]|nr:MAG: hypothetical protein G01um101419_17 [Parcubacteria group bacterium Gr01-1014_19]
MKKTLIVSTHWIFWQLVEIEKHLRDCSEDIIVFSKFLASQLDFIGRPDMNPFNFYSEWKAALCNLALGVDPWTGKAIANPLSKAPLEQLRMLDQKMLMFAEDLCGKEFAEEVRKEHADWGTKIKPIATYTFPEMLMATTKSETPGEKPVIREGKFGPKTIIPLNTEDLSEATAEMQSPNHSDGCHPFQPEKPVMEQEGANGLFPTPKIALEDESRQGDHAGFTKDGVRQQEQASDLEEAKDDDEIPDEPRYSCPPNHPDE